MNQNITQLYNIAQKEKRKIIGLMSGTSMDGLDVALCTFQNSGNETIIELTHFDTISYTEDIKDKIQVVFAKQNIDFQHLTVLNEWIGLLHGEMVLQCLESWKIAADEVDIIASHGQTVFHAPKHQHGLEDFPNATLQIGDGDHVAVKTGIITLSDFRQKHIAAGGEGAPLAVYGDYLIFSQKGENRIMLNMGGIGNFTFLPGSCDADKVFVTDTGPGNTMMDAYMKKYFKLPFDENAKMALKGTVNASLLAALKNHYFFKLSFPKTTGPEVFNLEYLENALLESKNFSLSHEDIMATLNRFSAETIAEAIQKSRTDSEHFAVYSSGGGAHNPLLMSTLQSLLPNCVFKFTNELGINSDAKEAVLFATLANEALCGGTTDFGSRKGVPSISMGKVCFPR
jgi:anhydro-N-acetylmuramic acid kinase